MSKMQADVSVVIDLDIGGAIVLSESRSRRGQMA
jgi:hypothetical protein